ncbi:uncharacterized protein LOC134248167 [Saccostrea cucullata]|uniref:uncharacterized protein LOC134248167 n=1 Tax=Saccostrea cuccullata TaxID=36930 RepID=UPI002ED2A3F2
MSKGKITSLKTWAQEVVICDECDKTPANQFCNSCQVKLCGNCINEHAKLLSHDIVHYTKRNEKMVSQQCELHPGQKFQAVCQQCDVLVCIKCIITSHKGHEIDEIPAKYYDNRKKIMQESEELQEQLNLQGQRSDARKSNLSKLTVDFENLETELEKHRKCWQEEVDGIFDKHKSLIRSTKDKAMITYFTQEQDLKRRNERKLQTIKENKEILRSKTVSKIVDYISKLQEYKAIPNLNDVAVPSLKVKTDRGKELSIEFGDHRATLAQTLHVKLTKAVPEFHSTAMFSRGRIIANIQPSAKCKYLDAVACVGSDEAWLGCGSEFILRLDIRGSEKASVKITNDPADISVTQQGELIYTDRNSVMIVRAGMTETLIKAPECWKPWGLCCTDSGDILVNMVTDNAIHDHKIVRYTGLKAIQEIENDSDGNPIFQRGNFIIYLAENKNGDICASDGNAKKVVVMAATGAVRFRYDGDQAKRKKYFSPEQIATDSRSQIIVTDHNNDCIHILDQNGQFLQCVDDCGLDTPGGLSVDSKGRCWVGLHSGKLKVISLNM